MASIIEYIEKKLKLRVNREKSGVRHCTKVKFLGYTLLSGGGIRVADKSIESLKDKIRQICKRNRGVDFKRVIRELNSTIMGWTAYFRKANKWTGDFRGIDGWIKRKLRCYRLKQSGRKYSIYKLLRGLGVPISASWGAVIYSQGWWAMSNKAAVNKAMSNEWFIQQGLRSIYTEMTRIKY